MVTFRYLDRFRGSALLKIVSLLPQVSRLLTVSLAVMGIIGGLLPIAAVVAISLLVAAVPPAVTEGLGSPEADQLWVMLAIVAGVFVVQQSVGPFRRTLGEALGTKLDLMLRERLMRSTSGPTGMAHLEDPDTIDKITLAQSIGEAWTTPGGTVPTIFTLVSSRIQGALGALILFGFRWWAPLILVPGWWLVNKWFTRDVEALIGSRKAATSTLRQSGYFRDLSLVPDAAKEIRIFGMGAWLVERFRSRWFDGMEEIWADLRGRRGEMGRSVTLLVAGNGLVLWVLANAGVQGELGIGAVALYAQAVLTMSRLGYLGTDQVRIQQGSEVIPHVLALEEQVRRPEVRLTGNLSAEGLPRSEISFESVRFRYPSRSDYVFEGLDLIIPAGRSLAIVGENGAGKTTLIKLLSRMYDPEAGRILIDDKGLDDIDPESWRSRLAVLFQDFVRYELSAADNVGFGSLALDRDAVALERAAAKAGAEELVKSLSKGRETILSRQYEGGADISGGEWQRIALARAFFAIEGGASVLVLDEPTANLDVRAEAQIYDRFLELTKGLTTILISHRFSSVRKAERICVLDAGRVVEQGSHEELMALHGKYEEMFRLQASRFSEEKEEVS